MKNKVYKVTYTDLIEAESEAAAYASLLNYLGSVVEYADVEAFEFEEVVPPTEPAVLEIAEIREHLGLIDSPVPPCPEGVPYDNHLVDCNCD
ncbi:MAG: hypothetical protein EBY32_14295 [Proteobacteria bacterium]|jgi:hypothetical protein|nr:hypothetical protein [Pseudomonadota bacterium]